MSVPDKLCTYVVNNDGLIDNNIVGIHLVKVLYGPR